MGYRVEYPNAEYNEILPNLFQGGHLWEENGKARSGKHSKIFQDDSWQYVVSSYLDTEHQNTLPQCDIRFVFFDDTEKGLSDEVWEKIRSAVDEIVDRWLNGDKVLVRCQAGLNRSSMIMALVLMRLGFTADVAINRIRNRRSSYALINQAFERYVREREDEFRASDEDETFVADMFEG